MGARETKAKSARPLRPRAKRIRRPAEAKAGGRAGRASASPLRAKTAPRGKTKTRSVARLAAPAAAVWALIGPFQSLARWHPLVRRCRLGRQGRTKLRRIVLHDGRRIVNCETAREERRRLYSYGIVEAPVPVSGYSSTLKVRTESPTVCVVEWESAFVPLPGVDARAARRLVESLVRPGLDGLVSIFGRAAARRPKAARRNAARKRA